jgi:pyridoxine/pyridoxamine 5'-phosphate oxidase
MIQSGTPTPDRPWMPGYGISDVPIDPTTHSWAAVGAKLTQARNYWISSIRPDGKPHAMPVWGLWLDGALYFSTSRGSRKGRNLAANPSIVAHLESGDDLVVLEGTVEEVVDPAVLLRYADGYEVKYDIRPDTSKAEDVTYVVVPSVAFSWLESGFVDSAVRWKFGG